MPTKEELSEQLAVTQKLAAAVDSMAKSLSRVDSSYQTQIDAVEKLTRAMEILKGQDLNNLNGTKLDKLQGELKGTEKTMTSLSGRIKDLGENMSKKLPVGAAAGVAAISGFEQGMRNVIALGKGTTGFFTGLVDWIGSLTAAIISIPFQIFGKLVSAAAGAGGGMNELAQAVENLRKEMGDLKGPGSKAVLDTTKTLKGFSDTGLSAFRVFGTLAERLEHVTKVAVAMGSTFGVTRKEFEDNGGALLAFQKGLGVSDEGMKALGDRAITMGQPMTKTFMDMTKQTLELGKAFDIDQKLIGKDMTKAMLDVKHFGALTVKEIGQASVYARKLGLELDKIVGVLDQFETFDSAAESAAKLSQSFGVSVDAFKMMEAQSPAEQIDMLRKSFKAAGVDSSQFTRQQAKLLATTTGLDEATAKQAFSAKNYGVSLDDIKKKSEGAEKKTLTQAEAMSKLSDSIERMVKAGQSQEGGFWKMFLKGVSRGIQSTTEFRTIIWNIKMALNSVMIEGVRMGRALVDVFPGLKELMKGMGDFFDPKKFRALAHGAVDALIGFIKDLSSGKASLPNLMERLQKNFFSFFDKESPAGRKMLDGFKTVFSTISHVVAEGIKWISDKMAEGIRFLTDILQNPQKLAGLAKSGEGGLGFLASVLMPLVDALGHAWHVIAPAAFDLLKVVGKKVFNFLKSDEFLSILKPALPVVAAALFGPTLGRALLGSLTTTLIKQVLGGGGMGMIKKAVMFLSSRIAGGAAEGGASKALGAAGPIGLLVAAGAAVGHGVEKYTAEVTSTMDRSSATIAAGATGLIDALTLGLLPDDLGKTIANVLAKGADIMFDAVGNVFGKGFVDSFKRRLSSTFEVLGNLWSFIKNLFSGDQASFDSSAKELGLSVLRFVVNALEFMVVQLPILGLKLIIKVSSLVQSIIGKFVGLIAGGIASGIDSVFGTDLAKKVEAASSKVQQQMTESANKEIEALEKASVTVSDATKRLNDDYLRSADDKAKEAARRAKVNTQTVVEAQSDALKSAGKDAAASVADVMDTTKVIKDVQATTMAVVDLPKALSKVVDVVKGDGLKPAIDAIQKMVDLVNDLDAALGDGNLNKVNIATKLTNVAKSVGLGSKAQYTVKNKDVVIQLNLSVTMNVDEVEKVLVLRKQSFIRDRINLALGSGNAPAQLPDNTNSPVPVPAPGSTP